MISWRGALVGGPGRPGPARRVVLLGGLAAIGAGAACTVDEGSGVSLTGTTGPVLAPGGATSSAIAASRALFTSSSAAVLLARGAAPAEVDRATKTAASAGVPCLVDGPGLGGELDRLGVERVLRIEPPGGSRAQWSDAAASPDGADELPSVPGRDDAGQLVITTPDPLAHAAAIATVRAALGSHPDTVVMTNADPRSDAVVAAVRGDAAPRLVVVGDHEGIPEKHLAAAARMATKAPELPGGGVLPFPGRRMIALYGHPGVAGLGLLGEQDLDAAIERAEDLAHDYAGLCEETVVPAFEIIATIADSAAGADGDYSSEADPAVLHTWVEAAGAAGVYVVLDLQPGRADFLTQAKRYEDLLTQPHVGLALDPEWRIGSAEVPLERIGHVEIDEVNEVAAWLAELTRANDLPQKVFTLHQFQVQMLRDRERLRTDLPEIVTLIHADGHGTPELKQETWTAVQADLPDGVMLGWKNFMDEDTPTFTPRETMRDVDPAPWFVSYQ